MVTPEPTYVHCRYVPGAAPVAASASQSRDPPGPFASVTVTEPPAPTLVVLTVSDGGGAACTVTDGLRAATV